MPGRLGVNSLFCFLFHSLIWSLLPNWVLAIDRSLVSVVDPGKSSCYYEELFAGRQFEVEFDVIRGGNMDISFTLTSPSGTLIKHEAMKTSEFLEVKIEESGVYEMCLDNRFSRFASKVVALDYFDDKPMDDYDTAYEDLSGEVDDLEVTVTDLFAKIGTLRLAVTRIGNFQLNRRSTEARDRTLMEDTFALVNQTSIVTSLLMCISTAAQVAFIRAMFNSPSTSARYNSNKPSMMTNLFSSGYSR